jgi:hypothetical protein
MSREKLKGDAGDEHDGAAGLLLHANETDAEEKRFTKWILLD